MRIIRLKKCLTPACDGAPHEWEFDDFSLQELRRIQKQFGVDVPVFLARIAEGGMDGDALDALLMWFVLLHRRIGVTVSLDEVDFLMDDVEFVDPDAPPADEEKPTELATTSHLPEEPAGSSSTSGPSPEVESTPKSSPTPEPSGGTSGSPS